jgi:transcriptional antiterminator NusG
MDDIQNMDKLENIMNDESIVDDAESKTIESEVENIEAETDISEQNTEVVESEIELADTTSDLPADEAIIEEPETVAAEVKTIVDVNKPDAKWYAIRTYTGHETKVKLSIEAEVKRLKLQDRILEVIIPQETVFEVRGGKRRTKIKNFLPGYILVKAVMDKKIIEIITNVPSVVSFVGNKSQPAPLQSHEIERIIGRVEERRSIATIVTSFESGDPVKVIDGPFTNFNGTVKEVNHEKQKLKVEVGILGRKTPVELDFSQVELENH